MQPVSLAVEGDLDASVGRRLLEATGGQLGRTFGFKGKQYLLDRLHGYNAGARHAPWFVLVDLDHDASGCAAEAVSTWLPSPSEHMCFRIAVREVESWLLADQERIAPYLGIPASSLPRDPDELEDPKLELVNCARRSSKRSIRESLVPRPESRRSVGPLYTSEIARFVQGFWLPEDAARRSPSLARAIQRIRTLTGAGSRT